MCANILRREAIQTNGMLDNCLTATHGVIQIIINLTSERDKKKKYFHYVHQQSFLLKHVASEPITLLAKKTNVDSKAVSHRQLNNVGHFIATRGDGNGW